MQESYVTSAWRADTYAAARAAVARASAMQSGMPMARKPLPVRKTPGSAVEPVVDRGHALEVSDFVLRALTRPAKESSDHGIAGDVEQVLELVPRRLDEFLVTGIEPVRISAAAEKSANAGRGRRARGRATST